MKFDIVYTYVDSTDINWLNQKEYYKGGTTDFTNNFSRVDTSLNEILYSIRSLEKYFQGQYGNIYIVSNNGKLPKFLRESTNIIMIKQPDLMNRLSFNSCAIESTIHLIPGLSEYYLYFNDDFLLNKKLTTHDFLNSSNELIWYSESNSVINFFSYIPYLTYLFPYDGGVGAARERLYLKLGINGNRPISHSPRLFKKKYVEDFINTYPNEIYQLRQERFRNDNTFPFIDAFCFWSESKKYLHYSPSKRTLILLQSDNNILIEWYNYFELLDNKNAYFLCIEDIRTGKTDNTNIKNALDKKFGKKCKYEY